MQTGRKVKETGKQPKGKSELMFRCVSFVANLARIFAKGTKLH